MDQLSDALRLWESLPIVSPAVVAVLVARPGCVPPSDSAVRERMRRHGHKPIVRGGGYRREDVAAVYGLAVPV
jgi:hypothetical protein